MKSVRRESRCAVTPLLVKIRALDPAGLGVYAGEKRCSVFKVQLGTVLTARLCGTRHLT